MESVIRITGVNSVTRRKRERARRSWGVVNAGTESARSKPSTDSIRLESHIHVFLLKKREREGTNAMKSEYYEA